jgi:hypothetical protein
LKYGPATGLAPPVTCAILSDHPAYQTSRSIAASTNVPCLRRGEPSARGARPRTGHAGPRAPRRSGRPPARGCTPCAPTSRRTPSGRP